jgi:hypothetical protein
MYTVETPKDPAHTAVNGGYEDGTDDAFLDIIEGAEAKILRVVDSIPATLLHEILPGGIICTVGKEPVFITDLCGDCRYDCCCVPVFRYTGRDVSGMGCHCLVVGGSGWSGGIS